MRVKTVIRIVLLCSLIAIATLLVLYREPILKKFTRTEQASRGAVYYCPMHPTYTSDRPGDCPICNMKLEKREPVAEKPATPLAQAPQKAKDICYMHNCPMVHDGKPCPMLVVATLGEKVVCPVCGSHVSQGETLVSEEKVLYPTEPSGYAPILLSPQKMQLIGVKTSPVQRRPLTKVIRTVGRVTVDETRVHHIHPKVEGWVDEVYAKYEGDKVKKNEPLFSFYSPDFVTAQQEYLTALKMLKEQPKDADRETQSEAQSNLDSTRKRLLWWDVTEAQVEELERQGSPSKNLVLSSPIDGVVLEKHVFSGKYMERGRTFYKLADLSTIWVDADLYEYDLPIVQVGQVASVSLPSDPEKVYEGKVIYIAPFLKPATRTAVARLELPNSEYSLKPDMYVTAQIALDLGERLVAPSEAVLDTGVRKILFVSKGEGIFEPRDVSVGVKTEEGVEIKEGVKEGEVVVTSGNFLIDSESRLKSAIEGMGGGEHQHGGHQH